VAKGVLSGDVQIGNMEDFEPIGWFHERKFLICLGNKDKNETAEKTLIGCYSKFSRFSMDLILSKVNRFRVQRSGLKNSQPAIIERILSSSL
jgi:hypothetical protein